MLSARPFGCLPTGEPVTAYTLRGAGGLVLEALDYGGIVTRLLVPGRDGSLADVVLGCAGLDGYLASQPYFGAIVGRVAGRVTGARFTLDGVTRLLAANDPPNHLHGGLCGFDKRLWRAEPVGRPDGAPSLRLSLASADGDQGYPGAVAVTVTYTVTSDNAFVIETEAHSDRATPFSLTHHGYFNLAGHDSGPIHDHTLQIHAGDYAPTDAQMGLLGRREPVTPANDFRSPRLLRDAIPGLFRRHGDLYFLSSQAASPGAPAPGPAAVLTHPPSGRVLTVTTTEACLQLYTGDCLGHQIPVVGKSGRSYVRHAGLCLECEGYPDGIRSPALGDIVLHPGRPLRHVTTYAFSCS